MRAFRLTAPIILLTPGHLLFGSSGSSTCLYLYIDPAFLTFLVIVLGIALGCGFWAYRYQRAVRIKLQKQNETIRKQSEELARIDIAKNRFFANVAHELRTPLTLILGPLSSLLHHPRLHPEEKEQIGVALENGNRLLHHIQQLLEIGRLESGKVEVRPDVVSPYEVFEKIFRLFESAAYRRGIDLQFDSLFPHDLLVMLDQEKVEQIIFNLLSNALKFTPEGGAVTLTGGYEDGWLSLTVSDTGKGITQADLPHIFDRYYQGEQGANGGGAGIGLSLSKELAEMMGGELSALSTPGSGSVFSLQVPAPTVSEPDFPQVEPLPDASGNGQGPAILVVEDNADLRQYLVRLLSQHYEVEPAVNGQAALERMRNGMARPKLLITDIMMPVMDGFSLIEAVRQDPTLAPLPVMVLTARSGERDLLRALRLGVDDYMVKPFSEAELLAGVATLMARSRVREQETGAPALASSDDWLLHLQEIVGRRLHEFDLKAEDIAQELSMSRTQFFRQIKKDTGLTPAQYLEEARFQRARRLLESGEAESVKAVAFDVGFKQVKYFSKIFKERFGKSPSEFLEK